MRDGRGEKRGPGELTDISQSPCPNSRMVCPDEQEVRYIFQEACIDEQGSHEKNSDIKMKCTNGGNR